MSLWRVNSIKTSIPRVSEQLWKKPGVLDLTFNKQSNKQGRTIFISPEHSVSICGLCSSLSVTRGESEGNAEHSAWCFMKEKSLTKKTLRQNILLYRKRIQHVCPTESLSNFVMPLQVPCAGSQIAYSLLEKCHFSVLNGHTGLSVAVKTHTIISEWKYVPSHELSKQY